MQYLPNSKSVWLTYDELVPAIIKRDNFYYLKREGKLHVNCRGGNGNEVLVAFDSLPTKPTNYQQAWKDKHGDPNDYMTSLPLLAMVERDEAARKFYAEEYRLPSGKRLELDYQMKYAAQCDWLGAIDKVLKDKRTTRETLGMSIGQVWKTFSRLINGSEDKTHSLPTNVERLKRNYRKYRDGGYRGLVEEWRFDNDFRRKVTPKIEGLMLALWSMKYKPTMADVHMYYNQFMAGELRVVDLETGEAYEPKDFDTDGKANELSDSTIAQYLSTPKNRQAIDKGRMSQLEWNNTYRPYHMRMGPVYAFSKVTMDDTASPFKMLNGDRPATYKMFDVASTALISMVMIDQKRPTVEMIRSLIMGVIALIAKKGWKMPAEIEMERALTSEMAGNTGPTDRGDKRKVIVPEDMVLDVLSQGAVFRYTRWCKSKNPQEKRAEGFIRAIKYGYHKHREGFTARPFAKLTHNKANEDESPVLYAYEDIYAMEMADMQAYNAAPHPDQKKYPGLSRWQVLEQHQNPKLGALDLSQVMPYVGRKVKTSVRRTLVQVQNQLYKLPDVSLIDELSDPDVVAYYMPDEDGLIPSVWVYQDGKFICEAHKAERYQEAKVEQTENDLRILGKQQHYIAGWDEMVDERRSEVMRVAVTTASFDKAQDDSREEREVETVGVESAGLPSFEYEVDDLQEQYDGGASRANRMF